MAAMLKNPDQKAWADAVKIVFPNAEAAARTSTSRDGACRERAQQGGRREAHGAFASPTAQKLCAEVNSEYPVVAGTEESALAKSWGRSRPIRSRSPGSRSCARRPPSSSTRSSSTSRAAEHGERPLRTRSTAAAAAAAATRLVSGCHASEAPKVPRDDRHLTRADVSPSLQEVRGLSAWPARIVGFTREAAFGWTALVAALFALMALPIATVLVLAFAPARASGRTSSRPSCRARSPPRSSSWRAPGCSPS